MRRISFVKAICSLSVALIVPIIQAQTVQSKGNQNVNTGTNNGQITVRNTTIQMDKAVLKQLIAEATAEGLQQGEWQGILYPGDEPTDLGPCKGEGKYVPTGEDTVVKIGGFTGICTSLPCAIISVNSRIVLSVDKLGKSVGVKAEFRASDGDMVAVLDGNKWHANDKESWYADRPNTHSIRVMDRKNNEMLWVSLKNPNFISVRGTFLDERGVTAAVATDSDLRMQGLRIGSFCVVRAGAPPPGYTVIGGPVALLVSDTQPQQPFP